MSTQTNPVTRARAKGYIKRPQGYQGINDAWMCGDCGRISQDVSLLLKNHGRCSTQYAAALVKSWRVKFSER